MICLKFNLLDGKIVQEMLTAARSCYGTFDNPDYHKVSVLLDSDPHRPLIESLRANGIAITETTDLNDDVSTQLVAAKAGDEVALGLSGVGPYATLRHPQADNSSQWVTHSDDAPTPLATLVAQAVELAGWKLLDRAMVTWTIAINRFDDTNQAT